MEGIACAAYVINLMSISSNNMKSPYELLFGEKPTIKYLKVFCSPCYVNVADSRSKLDAKAKKSIFIDYDERKKGWKSMDKKTQ